MEHLENMENMAQIVMSCLSLTSFGGHFLECYRGVQKGIFNDEDRLKEFLQLSEEKKKDCEWQYESEKNEYFYSLIGELNALYQMCTMVVSIHLGTRLGSYASDYETISTSRRDKYGTEIGLSEKQDGSGHLQPIPDYIRWIHENGELHYLSFEKTQHLMRENAEIEASSELFLPGKIVDIFFNIDREPPENILNQLALLVCLSVRSVKQYLS
ncbi:hypothetical protein ACROYT_G014062 [Oculina patagonica]